MFVDNTIEYKDQEKQAAGFSLDILTRNFCDAENDFKEGHFKVHRITNSFWDHIHAKPMEPFKLLKMFTSINKFN